MVASCSYCTYLHGEQIYIRMHSTRTHRCRMRVSSFVTMTTCKSGDGEKRRSSTPSPSHRPHPLPHSLTPSHRLRPPPHSLTPSHRLRPLPHSHRKDPSRCQSSSLLLQLVERVGPYRQTLNCEQSTRPFPQLAVALWRKATRSGRQS